MPPHEDADRPSGVPSAREWNTAADGIERAEDAAALYGIDAARPPTTGLELAGWIWDHPDGTDTVVAVGDSVRGMPQPAGMRPLFAPKRDNPEAEAP